MINLSSRRRHTRWPRDWSSDVCSSDLQQRDRGRPQGDAAGEAAQRDEHNAYDDDDRAEEAAEIGRASCREWSWVGTRTRLFIGTLYVLSLHNRTYENGTIIPTQHTTSL